MQTAIFQEIIDHGDRGVILPIDRLNDLKNEFNKLRTEETLSSFQDFILDGIFSFEVPQVDFQVHSIILIATPMPAMTRVFFNRAGKRAPFILPATYARPNASLGKVKQYLEDLAQKEKYHLSPAEKIPFKRLAVCSGLARYGRNNITYVDGFGSFFMYTAFFSDIPAENKTWHDPFILERCTLCQECRNICPTHAISEDRFLIFPDRCLTHLNETAETGPFPAWVPPSRHNAIVGCGCCQWICPVDRPFMGRFGVGVEFNEEETALLVEGASPDKFSSEMKRKLSEIELDTYLSVLPRNLKVLFDQQDLKDEENKRICQKDSVIKII